MWGRATGSSRYTRTAKPHSTRRASTSPAASATRLVAPSAPTTTSARSLRPSSSPTSTAPRPGSAPAPPGPVAGACRCAQPGRSPPWPRQRGPARPARRRNGGAARPRRGRGSRFPRSTAAAPVGPTGPPRPCRPPRWCRHRAPGRGRGARATPRGPTTSPHALSRGKAALSTNATRAPARARTNAVTLPAGPEPTTATSKRSVLTFPPTSTGVLWDCRTVRPDTLTTGARTGRFARRLFTGLPRALRPTGGMAVARAERPLAPGHGGPRRPRPAPPHSRRGHGTGGRGSAAGRAHRGEGGGGRPHRDHAPGGQGQRGARRGRRAHPGRVGQGRAAAFRRRHLRRTHLHLPPALRRGPRCDPARAGPRGATRGDGGQPRIPRPLQPVLALLVVGLHPVGAAGGGRAHRRARVVRGGSLPRAQHLGPLPPLSRCRGRSGRGTRRGSTTSGCGP